LATDRTLPTEKHLFARFHLCGPGNCIRWKVGFSAAQILKKEGRVLEQEVQRKDVNRLRALTVVEGGDD
jgi:hypothetical protein